MNEAPPEYEPLSVSVALTVGEPFTLDVAGVRALALRQVQVKEAFTVRDAAGAYFRATLTACDASSAEALAYEAMSRSPESPLELTLLCAVLARQRMLTVMQKATELGVSRIVPVLTERSVQREGLAHEKSHAWPGQVVRAVRQCRRASVPLVLRAEPLSAALEATWWRGASLRLYLDDRAPKRSGRVTLPEPRPGGEALGVVLAIGPEGGFTDDERRLLEDERSEPLRLGGRVLRAETAVLVGLTLTQHLLGDLR